MARRNAQRQIEEHVDRLLGCTVCPKMHRPAVTGRPVVSKVLLIGQAPGGKEPILGRPFAWTAGKTLFRWFERACGMTEEEFRSSIYMAAVCRCFPGRNPAGGDRVPDAGEVANCSKWLKAELEILRPELVIPVGKLAIGQFTACDKLSEIIGRKQPMGLDGHTFDLIALPHPSGASTWHRMEPGKSLLESALHLIITHPSWPQSPPALERKMKSTASAKSSAK
jgi:uracil-DNA glycosylase